VAPISVTGRAVDATGAPVPGAIAELRAGGRVVNRTQAGLDGDFTLRGANRVAPASIAVAAPGYLPAAGLTGGRAILHRAPHLIGRATDEVGRGIDHALIQVTYSGNRSLTTLSDSEGFFWISDGLLPGRAFVIVSSPDHDQYRAEVELDPDHTVQIEPAVVAPVGEIDVSSSPSGVRPLVDGKPVAGCDVTPCHALVAPGDHLLSFGSDLYVPWSGPVSLYEGLPLAVNVALERKTGSLAVTAPAGANASLQVDGSSVPLKWTATLPTGPHTITYNADDHWPWTATVNVTWNQTTAVNVASAGVTAGDEAGFLAGLKAYLSSLPGSYAAWVTPLAGGAELGSNADAVMEAASVIKIPVALYVYHQAEQNQLKLTDSVTLEDADFMGGTGTLDGNAQAGDRYSYQDLVALLIQQSDNTAWMALKRVLGSDSIDAYAASLGAGDCTQEDDNCTAREAGLLMQRLAQGKVLNPADTSTLLSLFETTVFNDRINYYLGGYTIAHKVGMDGSVMNDTGIVYGPRPFVVSVFTDADPATGVEAIRQVSRLAARLYSR
jgi:beta-lactamase class A